MFIGLDPDYGIRGHCCDANPPPTAATGGGEDGTEPLEGPIFHDMDSEQTHPSATASSKASAKNAGKSRRGPYPVKESFGAAHFLDDDKKRVSYQSKLYPGKNASNALIKIGQQWPLDRGWPPYRYAVCRTVLDTLVPYPYPDCTGTGTARNTVRLSISRGNLRRGGQRSPEVPYTTARYNECRCYGLHCT